MSVLSLNNICFRTPVLQNISYDFEEGKMYCISGKSGAGKTTLLSVLSGLAEPNSGSICYDGNDIKKINKYTFRSKYIGVVFQSFNLVTKFTAVENVVLSMEIAGVKGINKKKKAYELLESVGLDTDEANRRVLKLSGGQQQRVAIGRALSLRFCWQTSRPGIWTAIPNRTSCRFSEVSQTAESVSFWSVTLPKWPKPAIKYILCKEFPVNRHAGRPLSKSLCLYKSLNGKAEI
mgnify:CR=1 FL=1